MISLYHLHVHLCAPCTELNNKKYRRQGVIMFPCKLYFPKTVKTLLTESKICPIVRFNRHYLNNPTKI